MVAPQKIKPSTAGIWIGLVLLVLGPVGCISGAGYAAVKIFGELSDIPSSLRSDVPSEFSVELTDVSGGFIVGIGPVGSDPSVVDVELIDPSGEIVPVSYQGNADLTTEFNGRSYSLLATFGELENGTYTLRSEGSSRFEVGISNVDLSILGMDVVPAVMLSAGLGILLFLIGTILVVVTTIRRSNAKKRSGYGGGGPGAPSYTGPMPTAGYGGPGQGAPGYGAAGYGVPGQAAPGYGGPGQGAPGYGGPGQGAPGYGAPSPYGNPPAPPALGAPPAPSVPGAPPAPGAFGAQPPYGAPAGGGYPVDPGSPQPPIAPSVGVAADPQNPLPAFGSAPDPEASPWSMDTPMSEAADAPVAPVAPQAPPVPEAPVASPFDQPAPPASPFDPPAPPAENDGSQPPPSPWG
ncbi:MAG: hypothetical protein R2689_02535 [Microthrixaceae bacterium]